VQKLSKADRDTSVRDMRAAGATPADVFGSAVYAARFASSDGPMEREDAQARVADRYAHAVRSLK
jgi:hypothetical protein